MGELVGIHEIAELAGVSRQAVVNWRTRHTDFPPAVEELRSGPVFNSSQVRAWLRKRRAPMATVIATINLKGGVGKTTTTVAMAEFLAGEFGKRVLVVDLDPQTNATVMLIGETKWKELNARGQTLAQLFKDGLEEPSERRFDLEATLQRNVSNVQDVKRVALLPSSLDLIDVQDRLATMPSGKFYAGNPIELLRRGIRSIVDEFDYVLVDCPPNLGIVTLNGLRISHAYMIPTIPDVLSTYGIPQIVSRVREFSDTIGEKVEPLGIVVSKFRAQSTVHRGILDGLRAEKDAPLFKTVIPENNQIAAAAEFATVSTLRQKWGYQGQFDAYRSLAAELIERTSS